MLYHGKASLTTKISLLVTGTVLLVLAVLGFYFDGFLKENFLDNTQKRMQHGFQRLAFHLRNIEQELQGGVAFVRNDQGMIASIELINHYQDKKNYNTFLIDEEKKVIAAELLSRVKLSFNSDIAIYDRSEELVAFVAKQGSVYRLYFISFDGGERKLYSRFEQQTGYESTPFPLPDNITPIHANYYAGKVVYNDSVVTYQQFNDALVIKSHQNLIEQDSGRVIAHVELSNVLDDDYFHHLSENLDIDISHSFASDYAAVARPLDAESPVNIRQTDEEYLGVTSRGTDAGQVLFIARLNKAQLNAALNANRQRFLLLLIFVAAATLLLTRYLIHSGLARPLTALMGQIKRIERRDYATIEPLSTGDELEAISDSVNQLATAVREREDSLERSRKQLQHLSHHDPLTHLPNRRFFFERLHQALELAKRQHKHLAVFFLDLDQFKLINDTLGHDVGDELLVQVARRLSENARRTDTLARIGGDEFNVLVENSHSLLALEKVVSQYLALFHQPFRCYGNDISVTVSIGVSLYPSDGEDSLTLIKHADLAMYKSKDSGRNSYSFYSSELSEQISARADMIHALQEAIETGDQFELYYQPKISLHSGQIEAVEALLRWHSPRYGFLAPDRFIPLAEETGQIVSIGKWVLLQGCEDFVRLQRQGVKLKHISLNLSNVQMRHDNMISVVRQVIQQTGIKPDELELEITESYIATDVKEAINTLRGFRAMGVRLAVDDFGTGYSSMSYLQKLPVTRIKVDKSFVDGLPHDRDSEVIIRAIIGLAKSFGLAVTAEGVEHEEQLRFLEQAGCDEIQGYYFAKPLSLSELKIYCRRQRGSLFVVA